MDVKTLTYEEAKTLQAIIYVLSVFKDKGVLVLERVKLMKLLWAADRYHVRKYCAMRHGPVNSLAEDIAKSSDFLPDIKKQEIARFILVVNDGVGLNNVITNDYEYLSATDKEALDFAIKNFGDEKTFKLADIISHEYPEWTKYREELTVNPGRSYNIDILDFFSDPDNDQYFINDQESLKLSKEIFEERQKISGTLRG